MEERKKQLKQIIREAYFREDQVKEQKALITIQESIIASEGGIVSLGGLPKARKSTFMFGLIGAILTGREVYGFRADPGKILLIDTEQTPYDFKKHLSGLKTLIGKGEIPKQLQSLLYRPYGISEILDSIPLAIEHMKPKYVILDSVTDLVFNVNDFEESKKFVQFLKEISAKYNVCIVCLVHLSKTNNFTLGALGAYLDRVSQSTLIVKKDKETGDSTLEPLYLRSSDDFKPVTIQYNKEAQMYEVVDSPAQGSGQRKNAKFNMALYTMDFHSNVADSLFDQEKELTYGALVARVQNLYGIGQTYAKSIAIPWLIFNKLIANKNGNYVRRIL